MNTQAPQKERARRPDGAAGPSLQGDKYRDMRRAILQVLSRRPDGIAREKLHETVKPLLSESVYGPACLTSWYCVQVALDLEARGEIRRVGDSEERLMRVADA